MRFFARAALWLGLLSVVFAQGQGDWKTGIPLIVPGDALGWETSELRVVLEVKKPSELEVQLYSPGFDPTDYRSPRELGDERYDQGKGDLLAVYELRQGRRVIVRKHYGVEPHTWHRLFSGRLLPGEYVIASRFFGNAKNAVVFALKVRSGEARLLLAPNAMQTYNVVRGGWQTPFKLRVSEYSRDLKVGVYDGDGPKELELRVQTPKGELRPPVPGNRAWTYVATEEPGEYAFRFRIPETATQHTNTVGFKVSLGRIRVEIVDTEGRPVPGASYRLRGQYRRVVELKKPAGWELVETRVDGGRELGPGQVAFGMGSGSVRFVLKRERSPGRLVLRARVVCGDFQEPYPLELRVGDRVLRLPPSGEVELDLDPGVYDLAPAPVAGARVEGDARVEVVPGRAVRAELWIHPEVRLSLRPAAEAKVGAPVPVRLRAETAFPGTLPLKLFLELPEGLESRGPASVQAPFSADRPVEIEVPVVARKAGDFTLAARAEPCGGRARATLRAVSPAAFVLRKTALTPEVAVGQEAAFRVEVVNTGGTAGEVRLLDPAPRGFVGPSLNETLRLEPGERYQKVVRGRVTEDAGERLLNRAWLYQAGRELAKAEAEVRVLRPKPGLSRRVEPRVVLPGETVTTCLQVQNRGQAPMTYRLEDRPPDWLEPEGTTVFSGALDPGAEAEHCYRAGVRYGAPVEGTFEAVLKSSAGRLSDRATIRRELLRLEKEAEPARVLPGHPVRFKVSVANPLDRPVRVRVLDTPAAGLGMQGFEEEVELPAQGRKTFELEARPSQVGRLKNRVAVYLGDTPAARPASAEVEVVPPLTAERVSRVVVRFAVEGEGDALLIRQALPSGARYRTGTARMDGRPLPDPRVDDEGRLYWKIPFAKEGRLSFELAHASALDRLPEPELTLLAGDRELPLQGDLRLADYRRARPLGKKAREGLIKEPLPGTVFRDRGSARVRVVAPYGRPVELFVNGEPVDRSRLGEARYDKARGVAELQYYGVPLKVGSNRIEVRAGDAVDRVEVFRTGPAERLVVIPERMVADGRTPIRLRIEAQDALGLATGEGFVTVEASPEPAKPDAAPRESGYQVAMRNGVAELVLKPVARATEVRVKAAKDGFVTEYRGFAGVADRRFYLAQGSVTVRFQDGLELGGLARGYLETPLAGGHLQAALNVAAGEGQLYPELDRPEDPNGRFPLTGAGEEARLALASEDGVAFRYDRGPFSVGYGRLGMALSNLVGMPKSSVLAAEYRGPVRAAAFVGLLPRELLREVLVPDGTRIYRLSRPAKPGSERVYLERGGVRERLVPLRDYVLDASSGTLYLARSLWPRDASFVEQRLVVYYAPETAPRERVGVGAAVGYRRGGFSLELAAASLDLGRSLNLGAALGYRAKGFGLSLTYRLEDGQSTLGLTAEGERGPISARANLHYAGALSGRARVAAKVGGAGRAVLEHQGRSGSNQTRLLYEHDLGRNLFAGVGGGYFWEEKAFALLGRLGYQGARARLTLTHAQPFSVAPETGLDARYAFDANLSLEAGLRYRWGLGLSGVLGLDQKLGPANLAIRYQLPGAGGEGNRARFGVRAPLPLDDRWSLDLSAGYERSFASGEAQAGAGLAVRYRSEGFTASFGVEGATGTSGDKVTLRAGAAGQIDRRQVVSFDANYQVVPEPAGKFTLAYAFRGRVLQVLTYHRYTSREAVLEGELAPTWHPSLSFQLRPSAAYRIYFADPGGNTYQLGLGFNYYFTRRLGFGAGGYYVMQPGTDTRELAFSLEGSFRVLEPLWLNLGYTFGGFRGLTPEARPGVYLRLDLMEAEQGGSR